MAPRQSVEAALKGQVSARIPFTIYESKLPRCAVERMFRNQSLCIVQRNIPAYRTVWPNVKIVSHTFVENKKELIRTEYETPYGTLSTISEEAFFTIGCIKICWNHSANFSFC